MMTMTGYYLRKFGDAPDSRCRHLDGMPWYDRPLPGYFHRCVKHTEYVDYDGAIVYLCPCGGILRHLAGNWADRNSRNGAGLWARWFGGAR